MDETHVAESYMTDEKQEIEFAKGEAQSAVKNMRVTYIEVERTLSRPMARHPVIYKLDSGERLELSSAEGNWLANVLNRLFRR